MRNQCVIFITPTWRTWFETILLKWSSLHWTCNVDSLNLLPPEINPATVKERRLLHESENQPPEQQNRILIPLVLLALLKKSRHHSSQDRGPWGHTCPQEERGRSSATHAQFSVRSSQLGSAHHLPHGARRGKLERHQSVFMENRPSCKPEERDRYVPPLPMYQSKVWKCQSFSHVLLFVTPMDTLGSSVHGILQARILEWVAFPPPGDLPNRGIKPGSPALKADSFPSEPPGKSIVSKVIAKYFVLSKAMYKWDSILRSV